MAQTITMIGFDPQLDQLRRQMDETAEKIKQRERELQEATEEAEKAQFGVRVCCGHCDGSGVTYSGGRDIISDPPIEDTCENCGGEGFVWMRAWNGRHQHPDFAWEQSASY